MTTKSETILAIEKALSVAGCIFSGEVQLLEWSKSTSKEPPKIKFAMTDDESILPFEVATIKKGKQAGQLYHVFAIPIEAVTDELVESKPSEPTVEVGVKKKSLARRLHSSGYFLRKDLWRALGRSGIYTLSIHYDFIKTQKCLICDKEGVMPVVIPGLNDWFVVPLCEEHTEDVNKEMNTKAVELLTSGIKNAMKKYMGILSLSDLSQETLRKFEAEIGLTTY